MELCLCKLRRRAGEKFPATQSRIAIGGDPESFRGWFLKTHRRFGPAIESMPQLPAGQSGSCGPSHTPIAGVF